MPIGLTGVKSIALRAGVFTNIEMLRLLLIEH